MPTVKQLAALEILDSRGRPTVQTTCQLDSGAMATISVPSGASTGAAEALELRDGDLARYRGLGCRQAVQNVNHDLNNALSGQSFEQQSDLDRAMLDLDGTPNKSRLGANALLSVSLAFARASAVEQGVPLYYYFAGIIGQQPSLPRLTVNLFSGGKHAGGQISIQDVLVVPISARTIDEALAMTYAVYQSAAELTYRKYGMRVLTADEGGLAPPFPGVDTMLSDAVESIKLANLEPGRDVALAVDVASSHFYRDGHYHVGDKPLDGPAMVEQVLAWLAGYPIISVEDGLAEDDWSHWSQLCARVNNGVLILGDDLLCTNPARIQRAIDSRAANALLLKVNQIGTLTEAAQAYQLARSGNWHIIISARSGETEDNWLADLAVGWAGDYIKIGSITQSERLAKYNRLLEIEATKSAGVLVMPQVMRRFNK